MTLSIPPISLVNHDTATRPSKSGVMLSGGMSHPRFSGDAFTISKRLKEKVAAEAQKAAAEAEKAETKAKQEKEAAFKAIGDQVVWQDGEDTLNVAEMIAWLCRRREDDGYPGYGAPETLAKDFPGMDVEALRNGFEALHQAKETYLGKSYRTDLYWLRPNGLELLKKVYPGYNPTGK